MAEILPIRSKTLSNQLKLFAYLTNLRIGLSSYTTHIHIHMFPLTSSYVLEDLLYFVPFALWLD